MKNISAFGIYPDQSTVTDAIDSLKSAGFRSTDISVLYPENLGSKDFGHERHSKAPEGAVAGGSSGAVIGAAIGWLAGAGSFMVPGLEPLAAAGPIMGMMAGMGVGITLGGLTGALVGSGIPEYEAKRYEGRVRKGGILLSVHCDDRRGARLHAAPQADGRQWHLDCRRGASGLCAKRETHPQGRFSRTMSNSNNIAK